MTDHEQQGPRVALLGTGTMGAGMARNIAAAGLPLTVWNRSRDKAEPLVDAGATVADTAAEAVADADVVVTMLFDADSVASVIEQARVALSTDAVWLQTSTVGIAGTDRLMRLAAEIGIGYVDAPVLGTKQPAEQGALTVLASGNDADRQRVRPVLDAIGATTRWFGPAGSGTRAKLALNSWVLTVTEGVAHFLALADGLGVDPREVLGVLEGGPLDSAYLQLKGDAMLSGELESSFGLDGALKDAGLIMEGDQTAGVSPLLMTAIRDNMQRALDAGHGDKDMAATYLTQR